MVIKCPKCEREYDLELDETVVEMTFSCPNCKANFKVRNVEENGASLYVANGSEQRGKKQKRLGGCLQDIVGIVKWMAIGFLVLYLVTWPERNRNRIEGERARERANQILNGTPQMHESTSTYHYDEMKSIYEGGYTVGYTSAPAYDSYEEKEEWCKSYWGIFAGTAQLNIDDETKFREFGRGFYAGIKKRNSQ